MDRTACTEPQCLYKSTINLYHFWCYTIRYVRSVTVLYAHPVLWLPVSLQTPSAIHFATVHSARRHCQFSTYTVTRASCYGSSGRVLANSFYRPNCVLHLYIYIYIIYIYIFYKLFTLQFIYIYIYIHIFLSPKYSLFSTVYIYIYSTNDLHYSLYTYTYIFYKYYLCHESSR